jgi:actin-related protein
MLFNKLRIDEQTGVTLVARTLSPAGWIEPVASELIFESFDLPALATVPEVVATAAHAGVRDGFAIDCGDEVTTMAALVGGKVVDESCR